VKGSLKAIAFFGLTNNWHFCSLGPNEKDSSIGANLYMPLWIAATGSHWAIFGLPGLFSKGGVAHTMAWRQNGFVDQWHAGPFTSTRPRTRLPRVRNPSFSKKRLSPRRRR
jgi:hypothetical protein